MLEKIKQDICLIEEVGVAKMETFIEERIKIEQINIWATMQKVWLQNWSASLKNVHVTISNKVLDLKEDKGLSSCETRLSPPVEYFTDHSKALLLLWIIYVISVLFLLCFRARLFIDALWSPAGKGLTS